MTGASQAMAVVVVVVVVVLVLVLVETTYDDLIYIYFIFSNEYELQSSKNN